MLWADDFEGRACVRMKVRCRTSNLGFRDSETGMLKSGKIKREREKERDIMAVTGL